MNDANLACNAAVQHVVIVGTSYSYQIPTTGPAANEFRAFLIKICNTHLVRAIAEELHEDTLADWHITSSLCHELANVTGLSHRYCDLNGAQRKAAGVRGVNDTKFEGIINNWSPEKTQQEIRVSQAIRERHWMKELLDFNNWPVLFICGADHVEPFQQLLQESGLSAEVAASDWAPN